MITLQRKVVDELVGKSFYDAKLPTALRNAQKHAGSNGFVASLPQLVDARLLADGSNDVWQNWYIANSEENVGKSKWGSPLLAVVHGGGIWTPERIEKAYSDGLTNVYAGKLLNKEFRDAVNGKLPDGSGIDVLDFKEFDEATKLPQRYFVVLNLNEIKKLHSGVQKEKDLRNNKLFIVRAGGRAKANAYLDKTAKVYENENLGNWHPFASVDPEEAQGRLLFLGNSCNGGFVGDNDLSYSGRFIVGVFSAGGIAEQVQRNLLEKISEAP